jgi:hypothetical protein
MVCLTVASPAALLLSRLLVKFWIVSESKVETRGVRRGVSNGVEDSCEAVSGVACPQGAEGLGMVGPGETLRSPWPPPAIRPVETRTFYDRQKLSSSFEVTVSQYFLFWEY